MSTKQYQNTKNKHKRITARRNCVVERTLLVHKIMTLISTIITQTTSKDQIAITTLKLSPAVHTQACRGGKTDVNEKMTRVIRPSDRQLSVSGSRYD